MSTWTSLALAGVDAATFLLCATFITYVIVILVPFLRHRPGPTGDGGHFEWHFFVPCLDEEQVIEETVRGLAARFPTAHVWCIDDASADRTPLILARLTQGFTNLHIVSRRPPNAKQGKGAALNAGWAALKAWLPEDRDTANVIVGVVDADGELDPRCPDIISGPDYFGNPDVGAVQLRVRIFTEEVPPGNIVTRCRALLVQLQDVEFAGVIGAMQLLRRHLGSVGMGGNGQFTRLSALDRVADQHGSPWHGALLEDFELGLHVLLTGSRTEYCHDSWVGQEGLPSLKALVRQRSRWAQGSMQCFRYLLPVLGSPSVSLSAALEIAYFLFLPWIQLAGGVLYLVSGVVLLWYAVGGGLGGMSAWWASGAWGIFPLFVLFGLMPLMLWGPVYRVAVERGVTRRHALVLGLAHWPYSYVHHAATWWAFVRVTRSQHDWKKTARVGAPAVPLAPLAPLAPHAPHAPHAPLAPLAISLGRPLPALSPGAPIATGRFVTPFLRPAGAPWEVPGRLSVRPLPATPLPGRFQ